MSVDPGAGVVIWARALAVVVCAVVSAVWALSLRHSNLNRAYYGTDTRGAELLAQNPRVGMARDDIAEGVRHFPVGNYLILYRLLEDGVEIVRYAHGRRRLRDLI